MSRILITGSADGLGLMAGQLLAGDGHKVTLHARNAARAAEARAALPQAEAVLTGDVAVIAGMRAVAEQANGRGRYDAVIHNVGVGYREPRRIVTADGLAHLFAINVLAPYLLTALMAVPGRLVYLSSGMHRGGDPGLDDLQWAERRWNGSQAYQPRLGDRRLGHQRRSRRHRHRGVLLPPAARTGASGRALGRCPGRPAAALRAAHRHGAARAALATGFTGSARAVTLRAAGSASSRRQTASGTG